MKYNDITPKKIYAKRTPIEATLRQKRFRITGFLPPTYGLRYLHPDMKIYQRGAEPEGTVVPAAAFQVVPGEQKFWWE